MNVILDGVLGNDNVHKFKNKLQEVYWSPTHGFYWYSCMDGDTFYSIGIEAMKRTPMFDSKLLKEEL